MVPESRSYVHLSCGNSTEVSGPEFNALSDPLVGMERTYCAGCDEMFPLDQFAWEDTNERIPEYYARHAARVAPLGRTLGARSGLFMMAGAGGVVGLLLGIVVGLAAGWLLGIIAIVLGVIVGLVAGVVVSEFVVRPAIARRWLGVSDMRQLR